ncbi:glycosyltransferase [Cryobacterium melibiosiphilum]|uniref:Glycosyltransferase n=1 Tax=Cryobacterium melibiosiphilum TaxID=995039 RepID=A0A3A5MRI9_9MICO|nr:glycosyltransferase [Cryobacterium melibiosiphilum]RJT90439.1 glycosyltransferase [Cryobacterium melibiosiphilum]
MKILHIAPLFTPDGAFGGPTRVALRQTRELRSRGHDVLLVGTAMGYGRILPADIDGVPVKLFRAHKLLGTSGYGGLFSLKMLAWTLWKSRRADVVHVHLARDLLTMPTALLLTCLQVPLHLQLHGMIGPSSKLTSRIMDMLATRPVLNRSATIFYLSNMERDGLKGVLPVENLPVRELPNGVPAAPYEPRPDIVEVLFLARLHVRKRPVAFVEMAEILKDEFPDASYAIVGPDDGERVNVEQTIDKFNLSNRVHMEPGLAPSQTQSRMASSAIYVLPSVEEPFGMTIIEALAIGRPVVITNSCALAPFVEMNRCGFVTDGSPEDLARAVSKLLRDPKAATDMGLRGRLAVQKEYSIQHVVDVLEARYGNPRTLNEESAALLAPAAEDK